MPSERAQPGDHLPLSNLSFHILLALGAGPSHGYAIGREVEHRSGGALKPTTGALYQALKRLSEVGLVEHAPGATARSPDARRQYFRLSLTGKRVVALEAARLNELVAIARDRRLYNG